VEWGQSTTKCQDDNIPLEVLQTMIQESQPGSTTWLIESSSSPSVHYSVNIINDVIAKCTCPYHRRKRYPCKHIFMLERFLKKAVPVMIPSNLPTSINMLVEDSADDENTDEVQTIMPAIEFVEVVEASSSSDGNRTRQAMFMSEMAQLFDVMRHQKEDMLCMTNISDEDVRRGEALMQQFNEFYENIERKNTNQLRTLNTQRRKGRH
ncbi:unnamed protein product, partial [Absidia cylindrospora]